MKPLIEMLAAELRHAGTCIDAGVGTGRFALPLVRSGVSIIGVDISREMLRRLVDKSGGREVKVAMADATHLPFGAATFGAGMAAHVLHLIPRWTAVIDELLRVIKPRGKLLATRGDSTVGDWWHAVRRRFYAEAGDPPWPPGLRHIDDLDAEMSRRGAPARRLTLAPKAVMWTVNESLALLEQGVYSACWSLDDEVRRRSTAATRAWAAQAIGDPDEPRPVERIVDWRVYDLP